MIIAIHVAIALLSIISATVGYIKPTIANLRVSYLLVALTFASGFYLVWAEPAQILRTCLSGLGYLTVVSVGILLTRRKILLLHSERV